MIFLDRRELFGDPQADVGRAGDDGGVGMPRVKLGERLFVRRCGKEAVVVADKQIGAVVERAQRLPARRRVAAEAIVGAAVAGFQARVDDRPIAGAAAQIAGEHVVERLPVGRAAAFVVVSKQAHDDAGRAEAALRAVVARHRRLHRMQDAVIGEVLDRDQLGAIHLADQRDAGIDRLVDQAAVALAHQNDGAGAAVAFRAAFFGAGGALLEAQPVEHGGARGKPVERDPAATSDELQKFSRHRPVPWIQNEQCA